jgi:hypothetical protein
MLVAGLLVLLSVLAFLQYRWLGQISDGERERLARSLQTETARFAEDFNREMQNAYFNFQLNAGIWRDKNWDEFNARREFWQTKTNYPNLIKNFYFVESGGEKIALRFNSETKAFEAADLPENLENLKPKLFAERNFQPVAEEIPALLMPVREASDKIDRILIRTRRRPEETAPRVPVELMKKSGILIIELDENVIKNELFPNLAKKYFSESETANYRLAVVNRSGEAVFQTERLTATDAEAPLFDLSSDNFIFFANRDAPPRVRGERKTMQFSASTIETKTGKAASKDEEVRITNYERAERANRIRTALPSANERRMEIQVLNREPNERPRVKVFEGNTIGGIWTLNVQHSAGSLEQFIAGARRKNLAVSFGILSLLGVSIVLIFVSAQRAKTFAQRQIDFVSSVSHEFRHAARRHLLGGRKFSRRRGKRRNASFALRQFNQRRRQKIDGDGRADFGLRGRRFRQKKIRFARAECRRNHRKRFNRMRAAFAGKRFSRRKRHRAEFAEYCRGQDGSQPRVTKLNRQLGKIFKRRKIFENLGALWQRRKDQNRG